MLSTHGRPVFTLMVLAGYLAAADAFAETAWYESFEGPQSTWQVDGGDARFEIRIHDRVEGVASTGKGCERIRVAATGGSRVYLRHDVGHPKVIDGLKPSVQIKSDRTGLQMAVRVVLPRTIDPRSGQALRTMLRGTSYSKVGRWEQIRIEEMAGQLARQVQALRAELHMHVDPREAYVEHVLLNVYGGPGVTNVWIDDLDLAGYVATDGDWPRASNGETVNTGQPSWLPVGQNAAAVGTPESGPGERRVTMRGSVLLTDGRPMFPRIIQYQGESLDVLKRLGFNTIWLREVPTTAMLAEAQRLGLWLVCPPPCPRQAEGSEALQPPRPIGSQFERVLAWDLGSELSSREVAATRPWAERVRSADRVGGRPVVCRPESDLRAYSRCADLLLVGRAVLGTSLELGDYGTWLRQRPRLARPGTPLWSTVQTQPSQALLEQWAALAPGEALQASISNEQVRLMVYTAITSGSRGLVFESRTPLDAPDAETQRRAMVLELLNLELALAEPWLAAGTFVETVPGSEPGVLAAVLRTDRARLLVPIWSAPGAQFVAGQAAGNGVSFTAAGVPLEYRPYLLTAGGLEPLRRKRETGGVRVTLDEFGLTAMVLLTQDPLVVNSLTGRTAKIAHRAAELKRHLAAAKLDTVRRVHGQLSDGKTPRGEAAGWLATATQSLQWCDARLAAREFSRAYLEAQRAMRPMRLLARSDWQAALGGWTSPVSSPAAVSFQTLPAHRTLAARIGSAGRTPNALIGGDFEGLDAMLRGGWRHVQKPPGQVQSSAELAPEAARSGKFGLRLAAQPVEPGATDIVVETPPAWITSPAVPVRAGQMVVIHGWVQVPGEITGSVDGLLIIDSITGETLAERVGKTTGWREFTLYRAAPRSGTMTVKFALTGFGEAWVDDVSVHSI